MKTPSKEFFKGGLAMVALENPSGDVFEYRFRAEQMPEGHVVIFVDYFDEGTWRYLGRYHQEASEIGRCVQQTRRSGYAANSQVMRVIDWFVWRSHWDAGMPEGYTWESDGRCPRCRRLLRNHDSVAAGVGEHCQRVIAADELLAVA